MRAAKKESAAAALFLMALFFAVCAAKAAEAADRAFNLSAESQPPKSAQRRQAAKPEGAACRQAVFPDNAGHAAAPYLKPAGESPGESSGEAAPEELSGELSGEAPAEAPGEWRAEAPLEESSKNQSAFAFVFRYYQRKFLDESPFLMSAERQSGLIAEYQRTGDPETLDRIMASLVKWLQSYVISALRDTPYFTDPAARDDLLQHAFAEALKAIERHDINRSGIFFVYMKSYIKGELKKKLYEQKSLIKINSAAAESSAAVSGKSSDYPAGASDSEGLSAETSNREKAGHSKGRRIQLIYLDRADRAEEGAEPFAEALEDSGILLMEDQMFYERDIHALFELARKTPGLSGLELEILRGFENDFSREEWDSFRAEKSLAASHLKSKKQKLFRKIRAFAIESGGSNGILDFL